MSRTNQHTRHKPLIRAFYQTTAVYKLRLSFDKLREWCAEQTFLTLHAAETVYAVKHVTCLCQCGGEINTVDFITLQKFIESVGIAELRDILALETQRHRRIRLHHRIEFRRGVHQLVICQLKESKLVEHMTGWMPFITESDMEVRHLEIMWTVHQINTK